MRKFLSFAAALSLMTAAPLLDAAHSPAAAQVTAPEHRAIWVDTFNTSLNNHADVVSVVNSARAAKANLLLAQVRRRGDSWYLNSLEPLADRTPIAAGFDPLQDLINEAHANGIEVHAFVIVNAIWNRDPRLFPPVSPSHVFNQHGGYSAATNTITAGPGNWLTRTLLPENAASMILNQGYRINGDFWIDPGHPDAEAYTVDVLTHLLRNYPVDGLHLDRIRYPELSVTGQTAATGVSIGYNDTNVARFNTRYGRTGLPLQNDPTWSQWRRDQVTNLVRRIYLNAIDVRPQVKVSAALIAFGNGPTTEASWTNAEPFWRVFQDWRAWTEEGILDIAVPMLYRREHVALERTQFDSWIEWTKNHQYNRTAVIGIGAFLNSIEGTLRQTRRALAPSASGNSASGVAFYSLATTNVAVATNPFSIPPNQDTPQRPFAEFAAGLTTGRLVNGLTLYEPAGSTPVFAAPAAVPTLPWKTNPQVGHVMGFVRNQAGTPVDTGSIQILRAGDGTTPGPGRTSITGATDGGGFYGGVELATGSYRVRVTPPGQAAFTTNTTFSVTPGIVARFDITYGLASEVSGSVSVTRGGFRLNRATGRFVQQVTLTNTGSSSISGPLSLVLGSLSANATLFNQTDATRNVAPLNEVYVDVPGTEGLAPGQSVAVVLEFTNSTGQLITYTTRVLSGPGGR